MANNAIGIYVYQKEGEKIVKKFVTVVLVVLIAMSAVTASGKSESAASSVDNWPDRKSVV